MLLNKGTKNLFQDLQRISDLMPTPVYWMALDGTVFLGVNKYGLKTIRMSHDDFVGKSLYDLYPHEMAEKIAKHNLYVIQQAEVLSQEETIIDAHGNIKYFVAIKTPLKDDAGNVIGLIGTSIEITKEKEAERLKIAAEKEADQLKLNNEIQQIALQEKEKFAQLASKVVHDIKSPLSALQTMIRLCDGLPEDHRIALTRATERIVDITNNLLSNFRRKKKKIATSEVEPRQHLLVSELLIELLSEKKAEYQNQPVTFTTIIAHGTEFAFIQCQPTEFQRAMSNLINNAVDALEGKVDGIVTIHLNIHGDAIVVEVTDNGCGMPSVMKERMRRRESFTTGKENGHGLGLQQIWDTLEYNEGTMDVQSRPREGTAIKITFAMVAAPNWIAQEIRLTPHHIIAILDDDESIHAAWNLRFTALLIANPTLRLHHFTQGQEILNFLTTLSQEEKDQVVFLSDYELLHQSRNGLQIIEASKIKGAILVTSYYSRQKIREKAERLGVRVLPKQMASVIPIYIE